MKFLPITILAYFLNACAVTADKFLLKKFIPDPLVYIFYFSLYSLLALVIIPFVPLPHTNVFALASTSTLLWTLGAYFMFRALSLGCISRVIPVIGTLTPLILLTHASFFATITINQIWAVGFLIAGLIFLTSSDLRGAFKKNELLLEILSSVLFATSYLFLRQAYIEQNFLTVLSWGRIVLLPVGLLIITIPSLREKIFRGHKLTVNLKSRMGLLFFAGQMSGGMSELLLTFSISLATPALVNSLQGTQYVFLLIFSFFLGNRFPKVFEEKSSRLTGLAKTAGVVSVFIGLYILSFGSIGQKYKLAITYSPLYASQLGLDPKNTFTGFLDSTKVKSVRLPVYWNEVEKFPKQIDFSGVDFYLNEAKKRNVSVILVLGLKQPRWPECFAPEWVKHLTIEEKQKRILDLVSAEIDHFKYWGNIYAWQIENEPFLPYGVCDKITSGTGETVKKEVQIVKRKDLRPVLITDSGELSTWMETAGIGDYLGHSLYRHVWNPILGSVEYPLPPVFYQIKGQLVRLVTLNPDKKIIISELQAEPWIPQGKDIHQFSADAQAKLFPLKKLASAVEYAKETGTQDIYLWGVEWWYFMAKNGHPEYLQYAKKLFE